MDTHESPAESISSNFKDSDSNSVYSNSAGAFFPGSHHFTAGGTFTSVTKNYTIPTEPRDIRMVPLGDIDLQREIHLNSDTDVVNCEHRRPRVRRIYSAKLESRVRKANVTVAIYQGEGAETEWRQDIARYLSVRHPNIIQVCEAASSSHIHATVFYDDLIPFEGFLALHRHSALLTVYIYGVCTSDFYAAENYLYSTLRKFLLATKYTIWIRQSTGRLCVDLAPSQMKHWFDESNEIRNPNGTTFLNTANKEAMVMDLTVKQYNGIFYRHLSRIRHISSSIPTEVHLGGIIHCSLEDDHIEYLAEIAILPDIRVVSDHRWSGGRSQAVIMKDGRSRHNSGDIFASTVRLHFWDSELGPWTSQASHIFGRLGITSNLEDYVVVNSIYFEFTISVITTAPKGFLFLCPPEDFQTGPSSFAFPDCPAYWSLDPLGIDKLSEADAANLGFPSIRLSLKMKGKSWDTSLYAGLRHFHLVKGFDPDTQDVARHLGHPFYRLSGEMLVDILFAHIDDAEHDLGPGPSDGNSDVTQKAHDNVPLHSRARRHQAAELHGEPPASKTLQFFMKVQLMLILFLALSALYTEFD